MHLLFDPAITLLEIYPKTTPPQTVPTHRRSTEYSMVQPHSGVLGSHLKKSNSNSRKKDAYELI